MPELQLTDRTTDVAMGARRSEVLACLQEAEEPLSVAQVARRMALHVNTARFHLDGLVEDGVAERSTEQRTSPGRPRILYTARPDAAQPRSFGLLAEMLTGLVASLEADESTVTNTGEAWGRHLVERPAPSQAVDADDATQRLVAVLDGIGFSPEVHHRSDGADIQLHHCPFREVAERHADLVCNLHLGLMRGALDELGASLQVESLKPFVTPRLCVAELRRTA